MVTHEAKIAALDLEITAIQNKYHRSAPAIYADVQKAVNLALQRVNKNYTPALKDFIAAVKLKHTPEVAADIRRVAVLTLELLLATAQHLLTGEVSADAQL